MNKVYVMLGLVVVLGVLAWFVNYDATGKGHDRAPAKEGEAPKLPAIDQGRVQQIELSDAANKVRVTRAGEHWVLPDKFNAPAMDQRANDLLKGLQGLEKAGHVSRSAAADKNKTFGLDPESAKRIKLSDETGKVIADIWVGKPDMSGERTVQLAGNFVRLEGSDAVYSHTKRLQHLVMPQLSMWLEGRFFPLESKEMADTVGKADRIIVEYDDVTLTPAAPDSQPESRPESVPDRVRLVLEGAEPESAPESSPADVGPKATAPPKPPRKSRDWTLIEPHEAGLKPYAPFVEQIVTGVMYGRADDVVGSDPALAEYGFDRPFVDVEVRFTDGTTRHLRVGKRAPAPTEPSRRGGTYRYAYVDGIPRVVLINEFALAAFRKKAAELKAPDTAKAAPTGPAPIELPAPETRK